MAAKKILMIVGDFVKDYEIIRKFGMRFKELWILW